MSEDEVPGGFKTSIKIDGAQNCLDRVCKVRGPTPAPAALLASAQEELTAQLQALSDLCQGRSGDDACPELCEGAFLAFRKGVEEVAADDQLQNSVT